MKNKNYKLIDDITRIGNRAVKKAQDANRRSGLPNVYCINGKIVFELPDGKFVTEYNFS